MTGLKLAAHLFRLDRSRRVRTEQKFLNEIEYTLFYLTAHTSSDQTGTDADLKRCSQSGRKACIRFPSEISVLF